MKKHLITLCFLATFTCNSQAQYDWQNPLDLGFVDLGDKYALLYNIAGVTLSGLLSKKQVSDSHWHTAFYAEYQQEYEAEEFVSDVFIGKARLGYQMRKWVSVGGEVQLFKFKNVEVSTPGLGGAVFFNWYFVNSPGLKFYFDNGFGIVGTTRNFPKGGTSFNFSNFYGLSLDAKIKPGTFIKLGIRNMHLSNAFLFGEDRNPAFDSIGFLAGFKFY